MTKKLPCGHAATPENTYTWTRKTGRCIGSQVIECILCKQARRRGNYVRGSANKKPAGPGNGSGQIAGRTYRQQIAYEKLHFGETK